MKIIALVDCDSFFASCEKVFRPDWRDRPVVVLSNNDGCVVARSAEAKALQIPMGAPYFRIKSFAERAGVVVRSANYPLYADFSRRVLQTLAQWTPEIDVYSIDEAFLDLSGLFCDKLGRIEFPFSPETAEKLTNLAKEISETTLRWTGIPVSLGVAPTRTLAKAGAELAKMDAARTGRKFTLIFSEEKRTRALARLPVGDVWGVGRKLEPKFRRLGIRTALDLSRVEPRYMRKNFTIIQEKTVRELRGERVFSAVETPEPQKSLLTSRSFGETVEELSELEEAVSTFAVRTAAKLRARRLVASGLCVFLATNRFREDLPQHCDELAVGFARATNSTPEILKTALALIRRLYLPGYAYKKAGVLALDTLDESTAAKRRFLFEPNPGRPEEIQERDRTLCRAVDAANLRFGRNAVFFASEGIAPRWRPRSEMVSPCYLTDWNDIPVVYAK